MTITEIIPTSTEIHKALRASYQSNNADIVKLEYSDGTQVTMRGCQTIGTENTAILIDAQGNTMRYVLTGTEKILYVKDYNN